MKVLNRFTPILLFFLSLVSLRVKTEILPPLLSESELSACPVGPGKVPFTVLPPIFFCHVPPQLTVPLGKVVEARSGFSPPLVPGMLTLKAVPTAVTKVLAVVANVNEPPGLPATVTLKAVRETVGKNGECEQCGQQHKFRNQLT